MKKSIWLLLLLVCFIGIVGCSKDDETSSKPSSSSSKNVEDVKENEEPPEEDTTQEESETDLPSTNTIFNNDYENFKTAWQESIESIEPTLAVLSEEKTKTTNTILLRHDTEVVKSIFVSATINEDGNLYAGTVIGAGNVEDSEQKYKILLAASNLVKIADSSLSMEEKKLIAFDKLGLGIDGGEIFELEEMEYSINGINYSAMYELYPENPSYYSITVEVKSDSY